MSPPFRYEFRDPLLWPDQSAAVRLRWSRGRAAPTWGEGWDSSNLGHDGILMFFVNGDIKYGYNINRMGRSREFLLMGYLLRFHETWEIFGLNGQINMGKWKGFPLQCLPESFFFHVLKYNKGSEYSPLIIQTGNRKPPISIDFL